MSNNMKRNRKYYSQRIGIPEDPLTLEGLQTLIRLIFEEYSGKHYFQGAFGYDCVDRGYVPGKRGISLQDHLERTFLGKIIYPIEENYKEFSEETCFDLIEYVFDNISVPKNQYYHKWDDCGVHVTSADFEMGRMEYRDMINPRLNRYGKGYELMPSGEIFINTNEKLKPIVKNTPKFMFQKKNLKIYN